MKGDLNYIWLDVVYATNPYIGVQETNVSHFLLLEDDDPIKVLWPIGHLSVKTEKYRPNKCV